MSPLDPAFEIVLDEWKRLPQSERETFVLRELAESPRSSRLLHLAAVTFYADSDRAIRYAREAVDLGDDPDLLTQCGNLLLDLGDVDGAKRAVETIRPHLRDDFGLLGAFGHLVAKLTADQGDLERAEEMMEHFFADEPWLPGLGHDLANLHIRQSNVERAREVVAEALKHPSDHDRLTDLRRALDEIEEVGLDPPIG